MGLRLDRELKTLCYGQEFAAFGSDAALFRQKRPQNRQLIKTSLKLYDENILKIRD